MSRHARHYMVAQRPPKDTTEVEDLQMRPPLVRSKTPYVNTTAVFPPDAKSAPSGRGKGIPGKWI